MNCLECRQLILADPDDTACTEHLSGCEQCTRFREEIVAMDHDVALAFKVPVPEGLAARVLLNQSLTHRQKTTTWVRYSLAASFAAALVIAAGLLSQGNNEPQQIATGPVVETSVEQGDTDHTDMSLQEMMHKGMSAAPGADLYAAHAAHQPHEFYGADHEPIDDEALEKLMGQFQLTASIDNVVYAAICPLDGESAAHLVIKDGADQYTVMLLPDRSPGKMYNVDDTLWRGFVSPHPAGALAVLAEADDEQAVARIREVTDKMQSAIYLTAEL